MPDLRERGELRIAWARGHMPVLAAIRAEFEKARPLEGVRIGMALHVEAKTAVLALTLQSAGAAVRLASCNPLSTDDAVATALREAYGLETHARRGEDVEEYYANLHRVLDLQPTIVVDDGADLIFLLHTKRRELLPTVRGGNEETTTGVLRLRAMARDGDLAFPVLAVNDARMKHLFDNRYGTGQSTLDGLMTATNLLIAGKTFVVAGYGWCGRGIARRAHGLGAHVVVAEVDPVRALEALHDGFEVQPLGEAARRADFLVTATGVKDVVTADHLRTMKDGAVLANAGHFDNEVSKADLAALAKSVRRVRDHVDAYTFPDGRTVHLLSEGRLVNLAAGQGHPAEIMDMSFALQALCVVHLAERAEALAPDVHPVPPEIDERVARLKLETLGVRIDALTDAQREYIASWKEGT